MEGWKPSDLERSRSSSGLLLEKHKKDWAIRTDDLRLGYSVTVYSSQGLAIYNPQKVWTIDDYLQWSGLAYLAVSRYGLVYAAA